MGSQVETCESLTKTQSITQTKTVTTKTPEIETGPLSPSESDNDSTDTITSKLEDKKTTTIESKYTSNQFTEETDDSTDFDRSLQLNTPSVAHREKVKRKQQD